MEAALAQQTSAMELEEVAETAWALLLEGVSNRKTSFHVPSVASTCIDLTPSIRTVVLRGVDKYGRKIRFHTDKRSKKYGQLLSNPSLAFHFYDEAKQVQVQLQTTATLHNCDEVAAEAWSSSQPMSKLCYAAPISPGASVSTPPSAPRLQDPDPEFGYNNFCVVEGFVLKMEWLKLSADGHKRAAFSWGEDGILISEWLAP